MKPYSAPEMNTIPLMEESPILEASLGVEDWENDDETLNF